MREWLKGLDREDRKVVGGRHKGRGVFLAYRHAARQIDGPRFVGSQEPLVTRADRPGSILCRAGTDGVAPRFHQENPKNTET